MDPKEAAVDLGQVLLRLDEIERRVADSQALLARTYERMAQEDRVVHAVRADSKYEDAWGPDPLVSVRIATYQGAETLLQRTLPSLLAQTYANWEALVVGDATPDDTGERIAALQDRRIIFENLSTRGPYPDSSRERWYVAGIPPMNRATELASGRWLANLDHDDEWEADHLSTLLAHARATHAEVVYGKIRVRHVSGDSPDSIMGAYPPQRGAIGLLGALVHSGLAPIRADMACRFAGEPGDWNVLRRLWEAGAKFAFLDRVVATHYFDPKPDALAGSDRLLAELREWTKEVTAARDFWHAQADAWQQASAEGQERLEAAERELATLQALREASP